MRRLRFAGALLIGLEFAISPFAVLAALLAFFFSPRRGLLTALASELPERLGFLSAEGLARLRGRRIWWLHAASTGEVAGLAPLIDALHSLPDAPAILLTATTAAGREAARRNPKIAWAQLAALDAWPCVRRLLRLAKPERLILSETELWPTTILMSAGAGLRPTLINARMTTRSLSRYRAAFALLRPAFESLEAILAQSELDAENFREIGVHASKIRVTGNTKYDVPDAPPGPMVVSALKALSWSSSSLFVAGSTHPAEEEVILDAFLRVSAKRPDLCLVLAPRHLERMEETVASLKRKNLSFARWSSLTNAPADVHVLLLDAMGLLTSFWPHATVAFVGGTLAKLGGHNLLEPACAGTPVLFGPHTGNIERPASLLENEGGGYRVRDGAELENTLTNLLNDRAAAREAGQRARKVANDLRGATQRTLVALEMIK